MPAISDIFRSWEKTAVALVAFLVVVPSVINAIGDIWVAVQGLPVGEKEKINSALFQHHFKENPAASEQFTIESDKGSLQMNLDVYKNGDIFIDYGQFVQWFPFDYQKQQGKSFALISSANAWTIKRQNDLPAEQLSATTVKIETKQISNELVERTRYLSDGSKEIQTINVNTGQVISVKSIVSPTTKPMTDAEKEALKQNTINVKSK